MPLIRAFKRLSKFLPAVTCSMLLLVVLHTHHKISLSMTSQTKSHVDLLQIMNLHNFSTVETCRQATALQVQRETRERKVLGYSAHYDVLNGAIDIISAANMHTYSAGYFCHLWSGYGSTSGSAVTIPAQAKSVFNVQPKSNLSILLAYSCKLPYTRLPAYMQLWASVFENEACHENTGNSLKVNIEPTIPRQQVQFAVCMMTSETDGSLDIKPEDLVLFFETNALFGAERFYYYNTSASPKLDHILMHYKNTGLLIIIEWLHHDDTNFALMAVQEDCMYQNRREANYLVYLTPHDILTPHLGHSWKDMVSLLTTMQPAAAYQFSDLLFGVPSVMHCENKTATTTPQRKLKALQQTLFGRFLAASSYQKFFRTMYDIDKMTSHPVSRITPSVKTVRLNSSIATVRNYGGQPNIPSRDPGLRALPLKFDKFMCTYADLVGKRVSEKCATLVC